MPKILIADDSRMVVTMTRSKISRQYPNATFIEAFSGHEAIDQWKATRPDLSILDVNMPGLDGVEVLKQIKSQDPSAKVIMLTADRHDSTKQNCERLGASGFVRKKDSMELMPVVEKFLPAPAKA